MSDKIRISFDEVNSQKVDQKLQQQTAATRTTQHYQQQVGASLPSMGHSPSKGSFWYNTLFYMTVFGLLGGLLTWPITEVVWRKVSGSPLSAFSDFAVVYDALTELTRKGEITEESANAGRKKLIAKYSDNEYVKIYFDQKLSEESRKIELAKLDAKWKSSHDRLMLVWFALAGIGIAFSLSIAEGAIGKNPRDVIIKGTIGICLGLIGGVIVGLFVNKLYQALGGGSSESNFLTQVFARAIGWGVLGLFLAIAPGIVMKSPRKLLVGLAGGFIGGLVGGGMFDLIGYVTNADWASRLIGFTAIGAIAGLSTGLIENAAKTGWLKVVGGLITGKQFILYKNPTLIGSSPQCEIYLFKDVQIAPQHAAIQQIPNGYEIQDLGSQTGTFVNGSSIQRARLKNNDQVQIGNTQFSFQEKTKSL